MVTVVDVERDLSSATLPRSAPELHQEVADQQAQRVMPVLGDRHPDEVVGRLCRNGTSSHRSVRNSSTSTSFQSSSTSEPKRRSFTPTLRASSTRDNPFVSGTRSSAHDKRWSPSRAGRPGAACPSRPRDGHDHPWRTLIRPLVACTAHDETAHGVPHQRDLADRYGPHSAQLVEEPAQRSTVVGHVQARVVADVDRRRSGVHGEALPEVERAGLRCLRREGRHDSSFSHRPCTNTTSRSVADANARRLRRRSVPGRRDHGVR